MPFISPRRNEALAYYAAEIEVDAALGLVEALNRDRAPERRVTLFHIYLYALARAMHERPGINRFAAAGRLWQRDGVWLTFSAKQAFEDGAPLVTVKREFPVDESLLEMVDGILDEIASRRSGRRDSSDKEVDFALRMPPFLTRLGLWVVDLAGQHGLLPGSAIDADPLFASAFVANLGSVGLRAGYHHLWQYGTCSLFATLGRIEERPDGSRYLVVKYSYDERVEDGFYAAATLAQIQETVENPMS